MPSSFICSENLLIGHAGDRPPFNGMLPLLNFNKEEDLVQFRAALLAPLVSTGHSPTKSVEVSLSLILSAVFDSEILGALLDM